MLGTRLDELVGFLIRFSWADGCATPVADKSTSTAVLRTHAPALPEKEEAHDFFVFFIMPLGYAFTVAY